MALKRILFYVNGLILLLLILAAGIAYWYAWRPMPQTSGALQAPVSAPAEVVRDQYGVPHITASRMEDLVFLQGYITAGDRMWQMDALRRLAAGRLAEILGPALVKVDRESRRLRMERLAEQHAATLAPSDRALFAAYARGVNFYLETHSGRLPVEFTLLGYDPRPWRIADSLLIAMHMYRTLTTTWEDELEKEALLARGDRGMVSVLQPAQIQGGILPGSNAWVVSGRRSGTGQPVLANDPHLEYSVPGIWYMVHLRGEGLMVSGVSFPGLPGVIVGHNDRIAWGVTNLGFDVQDLYIERLDPQTGRYLFRGQVEQARAEVEQIHVKGGAMVEYRQWVTRHGPVDFDQRRALALRWAAADSGPFQYPILELNRAGNFSEFTAALSRYPGPGQNFVYADIDGNIGYQATGRLPIRRNYDGDVPVDGASGEFEWDGFIPFAELPRSYNPVSGVIVTANQNPFPPSYPYRVSGNFASPYRARQIHALLSARTGFRAPDMIAIQKDVYSGFCHTLAKAVVAAWDRRKPSDRGSAEAVRILRGWNGQMEKGTAAPLISTLLYQHLRKAITERAAPGPAAVSANGVPNTANQVAPSVIDELLQARPKAWFPDWDQVLLTSLQGAVDEGRRMQGRDLAKWDWGRHIRLALEHPVISRVPWIGKYFTIGPVPQSGSSTSVKQTTRRLGPSLRMALDLADWDNSLLTVVAGESGHVLSSHYRDHWNAYYAGRGLPFRFRNVEAKETMRVEPRR